MKQNDLLIVTGNTISEILSGKNSEILTAVEEAYKCHGREDDDLPHSVFLKFPDSEKNRIIGLPAYLGGDFRISGMKWIASYPENHKLGLDRASAAIILNSVETGVPIAVLEGSVISAKRTAASAALAAKHLVKSEFSGSVSIIGCGLINFETLGFLKHALPDIKKVVIYDISRENAQVFKEKCEAAFGDLQFEIVDDLDAALKNADLVSLATTSVKPHMEDLSKCRDGATVLHISLRDFVPEVILSSVNIVDDLDHVCRAQTSIHLAEQATGRRDFVRGSLPEVLLNKVRARTDDREQIIFSPFGLGILDLALCRLVYDIAGQGNYGSVVESFLPDYWTDRK